MEPISTGCDSTVGQLNRPSCQLILKCHFCGYESVIFPDIKQHMHEFHGKDLKLNDQECLLLSELLKSKDIPDWVGKYENMSGGDAELDGSVVMDGSVVKDGGTNDENVAKEDDKKVDN